MVRYLPLYMTVSRRRIVHDSFNKRLSVRILFKVQKQDRNPCSRSAHATKSGLRVVIYDTRRGKVSQPHGVPETLVCSCAEEIQSRGAPHVLCQHRRYLIMRVTLNR